jgi:hypothetical protein
MDSQTENLGGVPETPDPADLKTKCCTGKCGEVKPLAAFNLRRTGSCDGRAGSCRDCMKAERALKSAAAHIPPPPPEPFYRLLEPGAGGCQRFFWGDGYDAEVFECGKFPAIPVILSSTDDEPEGPHRTILRLCPLCQVEAGQIWQLLEEL